MNGLIPYKNKFSLDRKDSFKKNEIHFLETCEVKDGDCYLKTRNDSFDEYNLIKDNQPKYSFSSTENTLRKLSSNSKLSKSLYNNILLKNSRLKVNKVYELLKSYNGNIDEVSKVLRDFTKEEIIIIYLNRQIKQIDKCFTPEEDEKLFKLISEYGMDFKKISKCFKNKSNVDLKRRYLKIKTLNKIIPFNEISKENENIESDLNVTNDFYLKIGKEGKKIIDNSNISNLIKDKLSKDDIVNKPSEVTLNILNRILYEKNENEVNNLEDNNETIRKNTTTYQLNDEISFLKNKRSLDFSQNESENNESSTENKLNLFKEAIQNQEHKEKDNEKLHKIFLNLNVNINTVKDSLEYKSVYYNTLLEKTTKFINNEIVKQKTSSTKKSIDNTLEDIKYYFSIEESNASKMLFSKFSTDKGNNENYKSAIIKILCKKCDLVQSLINILRVQVLWIKKIEFLI